MTFPATTKQALDYFVSMGWTKSQSAGIVANLIAESNLNPAAVGDGGMAVGVAQWHGDRQARFAALMGKPTQGSTLEDQLAFVHAELRGTEKAAGDALAGCAVASAAGAIVSNIYERPADRLGEAARRGALAEQIFAQYGGTLSIAPADVHAQLSPDVATGIPSATAVGSDILSSAGATPSFDAFTAPGSPQSLRGASMASPNLTTALQFLPSILSLVPGLGTIAGLANLVLGVIPTQGAAGGSLHGSDYLSLAQKVVGTFTAAVPQAVNEQQAIQMAQADPAIAAQAAHAVLTQPDVAAELAAMMPAVDKINQYQKDQWIAQQAAADAAAVRAGPPTWDMTKYLVLFAGITSSLISLMLLGAIIFQAMTGDKKIDVALVTLAGPLLAISLMVWREIFAYRFGGVQDSASAAVGTALVTKAASATIAKGSQ